jgi:hypothetical protein
MRLEDHYFQVSPKVVPANAESTITIVSPFDHRAFSDDKVYEISYFPVEEFGPADNWSPIEKERVTAVDGKIVFRHFFAAEQEHVIYLEENIKGACKTLGDFRVYSVEPDLLARVPLKGDFHMHSIRSDGWESPAYVAAACRRIGMDFMAVTDHRLYTPSIEAQKAFEGVDTGLKVFRGEEIHPPDSHVHMINYGGRFSINELFQDIETYRAEVRRIEDSLGPLPEGVDRYLYASCCWCFDKIREAGGMGIFCHPYWFTQHRYSPSGALTSHLFETQPFDAFELIGGFHRWEADSNTLQVARYHEERAKGRRIPIVGASDSHGAERGEFFGWYYSIAFAQSSELADIISGVKDLYSVAVECMPGETPRAYGPFRMVKYALFLMREVFPRHDEICQEEGRQLYRYLTGEKDAADAAAKIAAEVQAYMDSAVPFH